MATGKVLVPTTARGLPRANRDAVLRTALRVRSCELSHRVYIAIGTQQRRPQAVLREPFRTDAPQLHGVRPQMREQCHVADDGEALADGVVHQASVDELRLREDRADWRRRIDAKAGTELRLREVEGLWAFREAAVAFGHGCRIGRLDDGTEADGQLDESRDMRPSLTFVGVEQ